jgi:hypothetical protein
MEQHHLTESSVIYPTFEFSNENKITQTAARLFFAVLLPTFAKPFGYANLGLGAIHLGWCAVSIKEIRNKEKGYTSDDIEKALIRLSTGVYDLAIAYLLCSSFMSSIYGSFTIPFVFAMFPTYAIQLHHFIFEKGVTEIEEAGKEGAEKKITLEIDHRDLKVGCLIKQFCSGLVETFVPAAVPKTWKDCGMAMPNALATWVRTSYMSIRGIPKASK